MEKEETPEKKSDQIMRNFNGKIVDDIIDYRKGVDGISNSNEQVDAKSK